MSKKIKDKANSINLNPIIPKQIKIEELYHDYFLDYASYVILERAVPAFEDGLKPVQRRIMHSLKEEDDGRFHKVASIIGQAMKYHPHGDKAIGDALVNLAQKDLLIEKQGNFGDIYSGDPAASPRYIEARISSFARKYVYNKDITEWNPSYDGRNQEPKFLPIKFPVLLMQGAEGIAVGLSTNILSHNFNEICDALIKALKKEKFKLLPDFITGGIMDASEYKDGERGGKIKVRANIEIDEKMHSLRITELPAHQTSESLINSIVIANDKGKIRIKKIENNTAKTVNILLHMHPEADLEKSKNALFAFTDCEVTLHPQTIVIKDGKPLFAGVTQLIKLYADHILMILKKELEHKKEVLEEKKMMSSLEKLFIENKIYQAMEKADSYDQMISIVHGKMKPFFKLFYREIQIEDIVSLTEIKIRKIAKFDAKKTDDEIKSLENEIKEIKNHLKNLTEYTINHFTQMKKDYGSLFVRKTKIKSIDEVNKVSVAEADRKLFVNRKEGFIGNNADLRKEEFLFDCSSLDEIICFMRNGSMKVLKVGDIGDKAFVGSDIIFVSKYTRGDNKTCYIMAYNDGKEGECMIKKFITPAITRNTLYDLTKGNKDSKVLYFTTCQEGDKLGKIQYLNKKQPRIKIEGEFNLDDLLTKGRDSQGVRLSKYTVDKILKNK